MASEWFPEVAPTAVASPDAGYDAIFIADGTGGTTAGSLYKKDSAGTVTALTFSVEQAQDAVGTILTDTTTVDFTYDDAGNTISAIVITSPAGQIPVGVTRSISTTAPLTGGGDLSANRTLALTTSPASQTPVGVTRAINTTAPITGGGDLSADRTIALTTSPVGQTPVGVTRNIGTTAPITGGGPLSADLTLALTTSPVGQTPVGVTRNVNTTAPITGGGPLSADLTLALTTSPAGQTPVGVTRTITATTPMLIDGTTSANLSADRTLSMPAAASSTTVALSSAGHLSASLVHKLTNVWVDVTAPGGALTPLNRVGTADNTAALQAINDALPTGGGVLFFPVGDYRFDGTVNITTNNVTLVGQGRRSSRLATTSATVDMFNVTGDAVLFEGLRFTTMVAGVIDNTTLRTAGYAVNFNTTSDSSGMRKCDILFQWSGLHSQSSLQFFEDVNIREYGNNAINGSCILIEGAGDRYISRLTTDNGTNPTGFAGVRVLTCASLVISDSNIIHAGIALSLEPPNANTIPSVECVNTFFDTSVFGMQISPAGTGTVLRCKFTGCWFGTHTTAGVRMNGTQWDGITFDNCEWYSTGPSAIGIDCPTGGGKWTLSNSRIAGYTTGINLTASAAHFPQIQNNVIGPTSGFGLNTTGITVAAGTYKGLMIIDNFIGNNTTAITLGAVTVAAGEASFYQIKNNAGYNPLTGAAVTTPGVPTAGTVVTNTTGRRVVIFALNAATAPAAIVLNGVSTAQINKVVTTGTNIVWLDPGGTIAFTTTTITSWTWVGQ